MSLFKIAVVVPVYNELAIHKTLQSLYEQQPTQQAVHYFIVDNGSTDRTKVLIEDFARHHKDFPLTIIQELQKGTGAASDTGFRTAIKKGYTVIARTDGDTLPRTDWIQKIAKHFNADKPPRLLGGQSLALRDADFRLIDVWLTPASSTVSRWIYAFMNQKFSYRKLARGCNMATRADTYLAVGGFSRSSMHELDEDVDYSVKVIEKFGPTSVRIDPRLLVRTSSRRIRRLGPIGTMFYYLFPSNRQGHKVDVR